MLVAALTQGSKVPSARFRIVQHIRSLQSVGIDLQVLSARFGGYPPPCILKRAKWLPCAIIESATRVIKANCADLRVLQRELVSTLVTAEYLLRKPYIFDVDDAIFHHHRGQSTDKIAERSDLVICGNQFLASHYKNIAPTTVIPTAVDTDRFKPINKRFEKRVIGWSGSSSGFKYLYQIETAMETVLKLLPDVELHIMADKRPRFKLLNQKRIQFRYWNENDEVSEIQKYTVGIMPLGSTAVERGKCSFKMLTYMAVGIPVVVSPFGMNAELLQHGRFGYGATSSDEWIQMLHAILTDDLSGRKMGDLGRKIVIEKFSQKRIASSLATIFKKFQS